MNERNVSVDLGGKLPHEIAESDPDLMRIWGEVNNAWDQIERCLYLAFDAMLLGESPIATQAIFYSQKSHAARRDMIEALANYALLNRPQISKKLKQALKRVKARSNDRNQLAHGEWGMSADLSSGETGPVRIALSPDVATNGSNVYSKRRLQQVRAEMHQTLAALRDAIAPIEVDKRTRLAELIRTHANLGAPIDQSAR